MNRFSSIVIVRTHQNIETETQIYLWILVRRRLRCDQIWTSWRISSTFDCLIRRQNVASCWREIMQSILNVKNWNYLNFQLIYFICGYDSGFCIALKLVITVKLVYNDDGYKEFAAITNTKWSVLSQIVALLHKCIQL